MKTKLLKKVRKRYEIIKVEKAGKGDFKYLDVREIRAAYSDTRKSKLKAKKVWYG